MDDPIERAVRSLEELRSPLRWQDVQRRLRDHEPLDPPASAPGASRRWSRWVAAAVLAVVAASVALWSSRDDPVRTIDAGPDTTAPDGGEVLPAGGLREHTVEVWTGSEYLVWGGRGESGEWLADGFRYDPDSGEVTSMSPVPFGPLRAARYPVAAWDGSRLLVCCGDPGLGAGAAYDPVEDSWSPLAPPHGDATGVGLGAVWLDGELFVLNDPEGGEPVLTERSPSLWALDPADGLWSEMSRPPSMPTDVDVHRAGDSVLVWARGGTAGDAGWRFDPRTDEWSALPPLPSPTPWYSSSAWTGEELVVWGISSGSPDDVTVGYRWSPASDRWAPLPPAPVDPVRWGEWTPGSQSMGVDPDTGRVIVVSIAPDGGDTTPRPLLAFEPTSDSWSVLGEVPPPAWSWNRHDVVIGAGRVLMPDASSPDAFVVPG